MGLWGQDWGLRDKGWSLWPKVGGSDAKIRGSGDKIGSSWAMIGNSDSKIGGPGAKIRGFGAKIEACGTNIGSSWAKIRGSGAKICHYEIKIRALRPRSCPCVMVIMSDDCISCILTCSHFLSVGQSVCHTFTFLAIMASSSSLLILPKEVVALQFGIR